MKPDAEVRVPAETAYVAVVRMATAGIAARLDFTLDEVEDLRMAVGEACALLLSSATADSDLTAAYRLTQDRIEVAISVDAEDAVGPDEDNFAWQVLRSTAEDVTASAADGQVTIELALARNADQSA